MSYSTSYRRYGNESSAADDKEEEDHNNLEENLILKASKLKHITISLGNEIRDSNKLINGLDADFDKSKNFLDYTIFFFIINFQLLEDLIDNHVEITSSLFAAHSEHS